MTLRLPLTSSWRSSRLFTSPPFWSTSSLPCNYPLLSLLPTPCTHTLTLLLLLASCALLRSADWKRNNFYPFTLLPYRSLAGACLNLCWNRVVLIENIVFVIRLFSFLPASVIRKLFYTKIWACFSLWTLQVRLNLLWIQWCREHMRNVSKGQNKTSVPQAVIAKNHCFSKIQPTLSQIQQRTASSEPPTGTSAEHQSNLHDKICGIQKLQVRGFTSTENESHILTQGTAQRRNLYPEITANHKIIARSTHRSKSTYLTNQISFEVEQNDAYDSS